MASRTHKSIHPEFIKPEVLKAVYSLYLNSYTEEQIVKNINLSFDLEFSPNDIDEILDYMNELYV